MMGKKPERKRKLSEKKKWQGDKNQRQAALERLEKISAHHEMPIKDIKFAIRDINFLMMAPKSQRPPFRLVAEVFRRYFDSIKYEAYKKMPDYLRGIYSEDDVVQNAIVKLGKIYELYDYTKGVLFSSHVGHVSVLVNRVIYDMIKKDKTRKNTASFSEPISENGRTIEDLREGPNYPAKKIESKLLAEGHVQRMLEVINKLGPRDTTIFLLYSGIGQKVNSENLLNSLGKKYKKCNIREIRRALKSGKPLKTVEIAKLVGSADPFVSHSKNYTLALFEILGIYNYPEGKSKHAKTMGKILELKQRGFGSVIIAKTLKMKKLNVSRYLGRLYKIFPELENRETRELTIRRGRILADVSNGKTRREIIHDTKMAYDTFNRDITHLKKYWPEIDENVSNKTKKKKK